jgi:hypothetical protein
MAPFAPPRFSTNTCWPRRSDSFCAATLAMKSVPPPAANGTTILIGFDGQACAMASAGAKQTASAAVRSLRRRRIVVFSPRVCSIQESP